ncbi:nicotianamine synthase [Thalassococcus sp. S3]|nr:nicotianamine synthase [Thalassococcus sp. S3]
MTASAHAEKIISQYQQIKAMSEISISDDTMVQFHSFLNLLSNDHSSEFSDTVLQHPSIQDAKPGIQMLFSHASSIYERYWAQRILQSDSPLSVFEDDYPYYAHYKRATSLEINAVQALAPSAIGKILMVGSGALPVTSLALAKNGFATDNLDIHQADLELGAKVSQKLYPDLRMNFIHGDIVNQTDLAEYDVIWLAALAGDEALKTKIIDYLYRSMAPGSFLVLRTAYNLRKLLYPSIGESDLKQFSMKLKIQTYADNFHSILIAQKAP